MMMKEATYFRTSEGTAIKQEPIVLTRELLEESLSELDKELADEEAWAARVERDRLTFESAWGPYVEQLSDTEFRWRAYERWEEAE